MCPFSRYSRVVGINLQFDPEHEGEVGLVIGVHEYTFHRTVSGVRAYKCPRYDVQWSNGDISTLDEANLMIVGDL